jgi:hypothetical protein
LFKAFNPWDEITSEAALTDLLSRGGVEHSAVMAAPDWHRLDALRFGASGFLLRCCPLGAGAETLTEDGIRTDLIRAGRHGDDQREEEREDAA